eukprot:2091867-Rhodomonas_salina.2
MSPRLDLTLQPPYRERKLASLSLWSLHRECEEEGAGGGKGEGLGLGADRRTPAKLSAGWPGLGLRLGVNSDRVLTEGRRTAAARE